MQFAEEAVALLTGGRVGYLPGPQSHQLVGEYHGAPSAMHSGSGAIVLAGLEVREAVASDELHCLPGGSRIYGRNGLLIYMMANT